MPANCLADPAGNQASPGHVYAWPAMELPGTVGAGILIHICHPQVLEA